MAALSTPQISPWSTIRFRRAKDLKGWALLGIPLPLYPLVVHRLFEGKARMISSHAQGEFVSLWFEAPLTLAAALALAFPAPSGCEPLWVSEDGTRVLFGNALQRIREQQVAGEKWGQRIREQQVAGEKWGEERMGTQLAQELNGEGCAVGFPNQFPKVSSGGKCRAKQQLLASEEEAELFQSPVLAEAFWQGVYALSRESYTPLFSPDRWGRSLNLSVDDSLAALLAQTQALMAGQVPEAEDQGVALPQGAAAAVMLPQFAQESLQEVSGEGFGEVSGEGFGEPGYNPGHWAMLCRGARHWNRWRGWYPEVMPDLRGAYLNGCDLQGIDWQDADLRFAFLFQADLRGADLRGAALIGADLIQADLRGADLRGASLSGAYLARADLRGADLRGAFWRGAWVVGAVLPNGAIAA